MFLNQLLEEYRDSDDKSELFNQFTDRLWKSKYVFKKYKKYHTYEVNEVLLNNREDLINLFNEYSAVEYKVCRSFYKKRLDSIDYLRIRINNMYGYLCDEDVYYRGEYYKLILTPKKEYFKAISDIKNGLAVDIELVREKIVISLAEAETIKKKSINRKYLIKFSEYKKLINTYLVKLFQNYMPVHEYEEKHGWKMKISVDGWREDNYVVRYFTISLTGYLKTHINKINDINRYKEYTECDKCGKLTLLASNRKKYCESCWKEIRVKQNREKSLKYYHKQKLYQLEKF